MKASDYTHILAQLTEEQGRKPKVSGDEICFLSAIELAAMFRHRKNRLTATETLEAYLDRIKRVNPKVNAFVLVAENQARQAAAESDKRFADGTARPLEGIPFAIKDLFDFWSEAQNTFGSKPLQKANFTPPLTSGYVQKVLDAGVVPLGKTNTPEFGHKGITDNLVFGPTSTPFDLRFNAGGSSGGGAAAAASFMAPLTQGSDAGGSVRIPAAMCGIVGFKPSVGRIAQDAPPLAHTPFFTPGPMSRSVADTALSMQFLSGFNTRDPLSMPDDINYLQAVAAGRKPKALAGMKIAYTPNFDIFPIEQETTDIVKAAVSAFEAAGAAVEEVPIGLDKLTVHGHTVTQQDLSDLWLQEMAVLYGHARDLLVHYNVIDLHEHLNALTPEFAALLERAKNTGAVEYRYGDFLRTDIMHAFDAVLNTYDFIVSPTLATHAVQNASNGNTLGPKIINDEPIEQTIGWCLTYLTNFTGHPSISVPAGMASNPLGGDDLPVGLHITGRRQQDGSVFTAAAAFEQQRPWEYIYPRNL